MEPKLICTNLAVGYSKPLVRNINLELHEKDVLALIGVSGSGKSTIIKTILGQLEPKTGSVRFKGSLQKIGYAPQSNALFPFLTLEENVHTFGKMYRVSKKDRMSRAEKLFVRLGLKNHEHKQIKQLSGGMRKRADLACALIHNPSLLVLDEPFAGLDLTTEQFVWRYLQEKAEEGITIILITHHLHYAQYYCTKLGLIRQQEYITDKQIRKELKKADISQILERAP